MKKRTNKIINLLLAAVWVLMLAVEGMTLVSVWKLEMLPNRYFALLGGVLAILWLLVGLLLLGGRKGKTGGNVLRCLAVILVILTVIGCAFAFSAVQKLQGTLDHITAPKNDGVTMAVYVRVDDPAKSITDAADYTFATVKDYESYRTAQAVTGIEQAVGKKIAQSSFTGIHEMIDGLYNGTVDAIILNSAYTELLEESEGYEDFSQKTRVLYEIATKDPPKPTEPTETQPVETTEPPTQPVETTAPQTVANTPFVLYFSGSDTRAQTLKTSRSDVNILVVVNPVTKQILLVNTPRDYYVENPAGNGARDKLTHCGIYGIQCSIEALEGLYGIDVDYYAQINFNGFETLIDAIGGVTVYAEYDFVARDDTYIVAGENFLNGHEALAFARERYNAGGDNGRGRNQMRLITGVIQKLTSGTSLISNYSGILDSLSGMFVTSMDTSDIGKLVRMQLDDMAEWTVLSYAVTGKGGSDITYSMPGRYLYVMYVNQDLVDKGTNLIERVLAGEILTQEDVS